MNLTYEKKFKVLSNILRASHFEWRRAAMASLPNADPKELVMKYWEEVGRDTADAYKQIDPSKPLPAQLAENAVFSCLCMGADAKVVDGKDEKESFVRHDNCPWYDWHTKMNLLEECQDGCDRWFGTFVRVINKKLGTEVKWETQKCVVVGDDLCLRRFWENS